MTNRHFRIEKESIPLTREAKLEVVHAMKGKSVREIERALIEQSSAPEKFENRDLIQPLRGDLNKVQLVLSDEDLSISQEIKNLLAHSHAGADHSKIVSLALTAFRDELRKEKSKALKGKNERSRPKLKNDGARLNAKENDRSGDPKPVRRFSHDAVRVIWKISNGKI